MCTNPDDFKKMPRAKLSYFILSKRIERFSKGKDEFLNNYRDAFCISGGEPTLSSDFFRLMKKIAASFPHKKLLCLSNGRQFCYEDFTRAVLSIKDDLELVIPLHAPFAELHDRITRTPFSFSQTVKGLKNILRFKSPRQIIEIRIVIHRLNFKTLPELTAYIRKEFAGLGRLVYIFFEVEGQAKKNFKFLNLTYTQARMYLDRIFKQVTSFPEIRFYHFPLCILPEKFYPHIWRTLPAHEVAFPKKCMCCAVKKWCLGVHKGYLAHLGDSEFRPIKISPSLTTSTNYHHPILAVSHKTHVAQNPQ